MSVIRKATPLYRAIAAGPSRIAMSASVARPLTPSTPSAYRRPFSPAKQLSNQLRTLTTTPPVKRFTRNVWAANPIVEYDEIKPLTQQPNDVSGSSHVAQLQSAIAPYLRLIINSQPVSDC